MRHRPGLLEGFFLMGILAWPVAAQATTILLIKPPESDAMLLETFNRVRGELRVHGFPVMLAETPDGIALDANKLAIMTEQRGAIAGLHLVRSSRPASAEIWLADRTTGKTTIRTVTIPRDKDAPVLLAIRAVDLLRTSLLEPGQDKSTASSAQAAQAPLASPAVVDSEAPVEKLASPSRPVDSITGEPAGRSEMSSRPQDSHPSSTPSDRAATVRPGGSPERLAQPPGPAARPAEVPAVPAAANHDTSRTAVQAERAAADEARFALSAGLATAGDYRLGLAFGPAVSAHLWLFDRLGLSLAFVGPLMGHGYQDSQGSAHVRQEALLLSASWSAWRRASIRQELLLGAGAMHVAVEGEALRPWTGASSSTWVALGYAGTRFDYEILPRLHAELSAGLLLLVPRPAIDIADNRYLAGDPQLLSCLGLRLDL